MDSMDRSILKCLSENSRQSATEISQTVHLSVSAASLIPSVNVKFFPEIVSLINESSFVFVFVYVVCRKNTND